ncbi:FMN-dependent NADH-azoreductase [Povalibacter uvarum]|uniref:FMN dependent NADH:quinone oxidoreductase n=1 Tax=Povalibacter uvarum TaxID=732238 RepID=A0A841HRW4_9GAMM|nr:NAD(P)H-dependent oxidoreductase [Povalibacter uvarum]MBB6096101.1 FMN-dependent NADH-azoreductase [Povalibacter uvarum]
MKTLLKIQTSLFGSQGQSSQLADRFVATWLAKNPGGRVITRDVSGDSIPHLTAERFQSFSSSADDRTPAQQAAVDFSDVLIDELRSADAIVFAVPMYNFSVPSTLRAYFDHVARAGVTFRYNATGPEGLIKGKRAYVFITRAGIYSGEADTQTPYLKQFLGFIGITDVEFVYAEGLAYGDEVREKSLGAARESISNLLEPQAIAA